MAIRCVSLRLLSHFQTFFIEYFRFGQDENSPLSESDVEQIYKLCIRNLEECVTRFPEHYKSMYRLVHIYLNAPNKLRDLKKCKELLLGTYTTALNNQIQGLFADRKGTNLFNVSFGIECAFEFGVLCTFLGIFGL